MRSKIAVSSREPGLDPVGACVGPKGSRVRMVVAELRGERIDVVPWNDDPAHVRRPTRCRPRRSPASSSTRTTHTATVIVPDDQLSLAIGKEGQNARLAAKLTGWRIDIKSESAGGRGGHRALASSGTGERRGDGDGRCCAVTASGIRCRNKARPGSAYCGVHEKEADAQVMKARKKPMRTCLGCGQEADKRDLVRFVRTPEGDVAVDPSGQGRTGGARTCTPGQPASRLRSARSGFDSALRVEPQGRRRGTIATRFRARLANSDALANRTVT